MPLVVRPCIRCCNEAKCRDCDDGSAEIFENHELVLQGLVGEQGWGAEKVPNLGFGLERVLNFRAACPRSGPDRGRTRTTDLRFGRMDVPP
jgi:hypothetical protein